MKKIFILLLSMVILFSTGIYSKENIINISIQIDYNNAFDENIECRVPVRQIIIINWGK